MFVVYWTFLNGKDNYCYNNVGTSLDAAVRGVQVVIRTLRSSDRLAIVACNHRATVTLPLTAMDERGEKLAMEKLDSLYTSGGLDIWRGLETALDLMHGDALRHIMFLTYGRTGGPHTMETRLRKYEEEHGRFPASIHTFGFGYSIESQLLPLTARCGAGSYAFIPDAGFVGTLFAKAISNILVTSCQDVELTLEARDAEIVEVLGEVRHKRTSDTTHVVNLDFLQYGQSRDILIRVCLTPTLVRDSTAPYLVATLQLGTAAYLPGQSSRVSVAALPTDVTEEEEVIVARSLQRCTFVAILTQASEPLVLLLAVESHYQARATLAELTEGLGDFDDGDEMFGELLEAAKKNRG